MDCFFLQSTFTKNKRLLLASVCYFKNLSLIVQGTAKQVNFSFNIIVYLFKSRWKLLFTQGLNSWNPQRFMKSHHRCRSPCLIYTTNSYSTGFNLFMLHLYVRGTSSKMSENTETPLQSLVVYELNQKVIVHIGVKQLEQTFFSVKAKESIIFFLNRNPVTVCISVWRSS